MRDIIVIFHGDCPDGFSGGWAAWKRFGNRATYIAAKHHFPPVTNLKNKEIYFVDFIYPTEITKKLIKNNKRVVLIDHHISAKPIAKLIKEKLYRTTNSGAVLAWQYFHPGKKVPKMLLHVEDVDRWQFKLPHTREISAYINLFDYSFKNWSKIVTDIDNKKKLKEIISHGKWVLKYEDQWINKLINNAQLVKFCGYKTLIVNSPVLNSDIGNRLTKMLPPVGIVWSQKSDGKIAVSLRSSGRVDVSKLAAKFGGGGHKRAAGFAIDSKEKFPWKAIKS
ncbi:MAG: DHHA1 domain-containing protein [bacterium]|nr:DHHA1 domain-containing protein [bacterium]